MLYPLSYEGWDKKVLVRGYETAAGWSNRSHVIILGRGLAAAYGRGNPANEQVTERRSVVSDGLVDRRQKGDPPLVRYGITK